MAVKSIDVKTPEVTNDIHPLILKRWSPRSFIPRPLTDELMAELFEAAAWSASANNEQPWYYIYALRGTDGFERLWNCLLPGNQPWAKNAGALFVACKRKSFKQSGKPNPWAEHDLGMANAQLLLQAVYRDIYGHLMAGFDKEKLQNHLNIGDDMEAICMGALGFLDDAELLEEPYRTRELTPRSRKNANVFTRRV